MTTLRTRLELALMQKEGATKAGLARACGVTKPAVSAWFSGAAQAMTGDNLLAASKYLAVRPDWLASGRGPMSNLGALPQNRGNSATHSDAPIADNGGLELRPHTRRLPLLRWEQVGEIGIMQTEKPEATAYIETPFESSEGSYLLELSSESMLPEYRPGEIIQVDPMLTARHGDDVIMILADGRSLFRRLFSGEEGRVLQALNPQWPDRLTTMPADARIAGVVVGSWMTRRK